MNILFLAPEVLPPYCEGRKRFVADLVRTLSHLGHRVTLLTSGAAGGAQVGRTDTLIVPASHRITRLFAPVFSLGKVIGAQRPDVVLSFPFGTFSGMHYLPSRLFLILADRICRARGVPCLTILYSIDRLSRPEALSRYVSRLITGQIPGWHGPVLPLGRDFTEWPPRPTPVGTGRRILFLAGMRKPTREHLDHVLWVRGLAYLLQAGAILSSQGFSLHAAVPLLESAQCRDWLLRHNDNLWPQDSISLSGEAEVPAIFHGADVFVFPYGEDITQFTPTSIVESMAAGTPVAMSDLSFLRPLAQGGAAALFAPRDPVALAQCLLSLLADQERLTTQVRIARERAFASHGITGSARELLALMV